MSAAAAALLRMGFCDTDFTRQSAGSTVDNRVQLQVLKSTIPRSLMLGTLVSRAAKTRSKEYPS